MEGPDDPEDDPEYFRRIAAREAFTRATVGVMARNGLNALIYPTSQVAAPTMAGRKAWTTLTFPTNTLIASQTWSPAITVPAGFTGDGLPVGLEFVAAALRRADRVPARLRLRASHAAQAGAVRSGHRVNPIAH